MSELTLCDKYPVCSAGITVRMLNDHEKKKKIYDNQNTALKHAIVFIFIFCHQQESKARRIFEIIVRMLSKKVEYNNENTTQLCHDLRGSSTRQISC